MFRTAIVSSLRFSLPALALGLVALTAFSGPGPALLATPQSTPTVVHTVVSAGRTTPYTEMKQIETDVQADRIGDIFGAALMNEGGQSADFIPALRSIESQFASVQVLPKEIVYCYEYDPKTGRIYIICKEKRAALIVESPGDNPVELHLDVSTQL